MSACLNDCWVRPATTRVASTMNPQEVCALHRKNGYDLILLDLQMPSMDGFQVMADLKTNASDSYLPVIVLTAQPAHRLRALQTGAKDFISKPFDLLEVKTRIHNMLEVRHAGRRTTSLADRLSKVAGASDRGRFAAPTLSKDAYGSR